MKKTHVKHLGNKRTTDDIVWINYEEYKAHVEWTKQRHKEWIKFINKDKDDND